jgi:general secretion pathway protein A
MNKKHMLSRYGLKWNPFRQEIPIEGIVIDEALEAFCFRAENTVMDGGFSMISGPVGTGKSIAMRVLSNRLEKIKDVKMVELERPQSGLADFYRELGDAFGIDLKPSNRWGGYKALRHKWQSHISSTHFRPVIFIDEAQDMHGIVLNELRVISSAKFDSMSILAVVLAGDERLPERFKNSDLLPLGSRIKIRLLTGPKSREEILYALQDLLEKAGNAALMSQELKEVLADKSMGNWRTLMAFAEQLLATAMIRDCDKLDVPLFMEIFNANPRKKIGRKA